jgi:hypothetical protein
MYCNRNRGNKWKYREGVEEWLEKETCRRLNERKQGRRYGHGRGLQRENRRKRSKKLGRGDGIESKDKVKNAEEKRLMEWIEENGWEVLNGRALQRENRRKRSKKLGRGEGIKSKEGGKCRGEETDEIGGRKWMGSVEREQRRGRRRRMD